MAADTQQQVFRRRARSVWTGDAQEGGAQVSFQTSGAIPDQTVTLGGRFSETGEKQTDPEELLAASHAACYSMALSVVLTRQGTPPEQLTVGSTVSIRSEGDGFTVASSKLKVSGRVPGLDQAGFEEAARQADAGCPISNAIRGGVDVEVEATLES
jgi:osmotically inducible protein OsmC